MDSTAAVAAENSPRISVGNFVAAARLGDIDTVRQYIAYNPDAINAVGEDGDTALSWAAAYGHIAIVRALLAVPNINVNATDIGGKTALMWAAINGHSNIVRVLLAAPRINLNVKDCDESTAEDLARSHDHQEIHDLIAAVERASSAAAAANSSEATRPADTATVRATRVRMFDKPFVSSQPPSEQVNSKPIDMVNDNTENAAENAKLKV